MSKVAFLGRSWSRRSRRAKREPTQYPQIFLDLPIDLLRPPTEMPRWTPTSVRTGKQTEDKTKKLVPEAWNHVRRVISHQRQNKVRHNICVDVHLAMLLLSIVCNSIMLHMGHGQYFIYEYFQVIILKSVLSLLIRFFRFWETMFVFPVYSIVFWWFFSKWWDTSWHFQMQHNQAKFSDIHFLHGTVATTGTATTITSQPPLSPTTVTTTTITNTTLTKTSFSHLRLSDFEGILAGKLRFHIFTFSSRNLFRKPCHSSWTSNVRQEKQFFGEPWASVWPIGSMCFFGYRFVVVRVIVWDTWLDQNNLQNNDSGKPFFWEILHAILNKVWGCRRKRKAQTPKGIEERAEWKASTLFLPQGKTLFFPFPTMLRCH